MPVSYRLDGGVVVITLTGTSRVDESRRLLALAASDPRLSPNTPVLLDTRASRDDATRVELQNQARFLASLHGRLGPAYAIVAADPLRFGLARMFGALGRAEGLDIAVFEDVQEARVWLESWRRRAPARPRALAPLGHGAH